MTINLAELEAMIATARNRARSSWRTAGQSLNVLTAGDERPLTTGAADMYLDFYAWLWSREPPEAERRQVVSRLKQVPIAADWALRDAVRAVCALWAQLQELPEQDREAVRALLRQELEPGHYPELTGRAEAGALSEPGAGPLSPDALTGKLMGDAGQAAGGGQPRPPGFF